MLTSCRCNHYHIKLNICISLQNQSIRRRKINYKRAKRDIQEKDQTVVDSEAVHEEELVEAEEETISDDILAYEISCGGMRGMSILKTL